MPEDCQIETSSKKRIKVGEPKIETNAVDADPIVVGRSLVDHVVKHWLKKDEHSLNKVTLNVHEAFSEAIKEINEKKKSNCLAPMLVKSIEEATLFKIPCICSLYRSEAGKQGQTISCSLCDGNSSFLSSENFYSIILQTLTETNTRVPSSFDKWWLQNAYAHSVWKLYSFSRFLPSHRITSVQSVLYTIMKKYHKEFMLGKQSFFQRVVQEDEQISRHFVGLIAAIKVDLEGKFTVMVSDGSYSLDCDEITWHQTDSRFNSKTADSKLKQFIERGRICVGQKLHFVCQTMRKELSDSKLETKHYFLEN